MGGEIYAPHRPMGQGAGFKVLTKPMPGEEIFNEAIDAEAPRVDKRPRPRPYNARMSCEHRPEAEGGSPAAGGGPAGAPAGRLRMQAA
jgi:hypothetical protein